MLRVPSKVAPSIYPRKHSGSQVCFCKAILSPEVFLHCLCRAQESLDLSEATFSGSMTGGANLLLLK